MTGTSSFIASKLELSYSKTSVRLNKDYRLVISNYHQQQSMLPLTIISSPFTFIFTSHFRNSSDKLGQFAAFKFVAPSGSSAAADRQLAVRVYVTVFIGSTVYVTVPFKKGLQPHSQVRKKTLMISVTIYNTL